MTLQEKIAELKTQYDIVAEINLDLCYDMDEFHVKAWFRKIMSEIHKEAYGPNERIIFTLTQGDVYADNEVVAGSVITQFQKKLNEVDISNYFVILLTNDATIPVAYSQAQSAISSDPVPINIILYETTITEKNISATKASNIHTFDYNSLLPMKISLDELTKNEQFLLMGSKTFCMYPWVHLHAYPTGHAYPCCMADMKFPIGDCKTNTMEEIWNDRPMRELRKSMLTENSSDACSRCYEQEASGFVSGRNSANKHHGHHIKRIAETWSDGTFENFELTYWDIRFSNLCNLSCRSCGHVFSSSCIKTKPRYQDQTGKKHTRF
jgi:radical SAM protein with 4Fe4S-binding SPASM domain